MAEPEKDFTGVAETLATRTPTPFMAVLSESILTNQAWRMFKKPTEKAETLLGGTLRLMSARLVVQYEAEREANEYEMHSGLPLEDYFRSELSVLLRPYSLEPDTIVDREGELLWEYQPRPDQVLSERISRLVTEILGKVMELGTGRNARDAVQVYDIPIPSFGKTGTANQFTNSSFVGFIPGPNDQTEQLDTLEGYVIASYVGYDDNRPMKGKHLAIYGASGAMPLWIDTANAIVNAHDYKKNIQPADLVFNPVSSPLKNNRDFLTVPVSPFTGLPLGTSAKNADPSPPSASSGKEGRQTDQPRILSEVVYRGGILVPKRHFEPIEGK